MMRIQGGANIDIKRRMMYINHISFSNDTLKAGGAVLVGVNAALKDGDDVLKLSIISGG